MGRAPKVISQVSSVGQQTAAQGFATSEMGLRGKLHRSNPEPLMSALGQKQTCAAHKLMSALAPIATSIAFFGMSALGRGHVLTRSPRPQLHAESGGLQAQVFWRFG